MPSSLAKEQLQLSRVQLDFRTGKERQDRCLSVGITTEGRAVEHGCRVLWWEAG